jgi:hypothetical protein
LVLPSHSDERTSPESTGVNRLQNVETDPVLEDLCDELPTVTHDDRA